MGNGMGGVYIVIAGAVIFVVAVVAAMIHTKVKHRKNMRRGDLERGAGRGHPPLRKQSQHAPKMTMAGRTWVRGGQREVSGAAHLVLLRRLLAIDGGSLPH